MSESAPPSETPRERALELELRRENERVAVDRLSRVHGTHEVQAGLLALLLPPGSKRARATWHVENEDALNAQVVLDDVACLGEWSRLPWFEWLLARMAGAPLPARKALLESTRRLMSARNHIRPIDRLHWLAMRQRLGEQASFGPRVGAETDISLLPESAVMAIAGFTAFLARMVPSDGAAAGADADAGPAWYATVMVPWQHRAELPPCVAPDIDGLVNALQTLRTLPWLQRPVLVRSWVAAAVKHSRHGQLEPIAADALRLSCTLLDSPLPPDLAAHYIESSPGSPR